MSRLDQGALDVTCAAFSMSDLGNAERIRARFGPVLRYCTDQGAWLFWDEKRWARDEGAVIRCGMAMSRAIDAEVLAEGSDERRKALRDHAARSQSRTSINAALDLCRSLIGVEIKGAELDTDPNLLNCPNGTIDLRTGEVRAHRREDYITKISGCDYDPLASSVIFDQFLVDATANDAELMDFLCRAFGYTATGSTSEEKLFFIFGPAAAGKSTISEATKAALGEYARTADFDAFLQRSNTGSARGDIARLASARFVLSIEVTDGQRLAEGLVKQLTGGDVVTARHLYKEEFEFRPQFKLWLAANDKPKVRDSDTGMWRRILLVPFEHTVPLEKRDPKVKAAMIDPHIAGPAVLAWIVRGAVAWYKDGLKVPASVDAATIAYKAEMDPLKGWVDDCCHFGTDPGCFVIAADLRRSYEDWSRSNGQKFTLSAREFSKRLIARGCESRPQWVPAMHGTIRCWVRVRLLEAGELSQPDSLHLTPPNATFSKVSPAYGDDKVYGNTRKFCKVGKVVDAAVVAEKSAPEIPYGITAEQAIQAELDAQW